MSAGTSRVRVELDDRVAVLTLDDPDRRNALDLDLVTEIETHVDELEQGGACGAIVVTGAAACVLRRRGPEPPRSHGRRRTPTHLPRVHAAGGVSPAHDRGGERRRGRRGCEHGAVL